MKIINAEWEKRNLGVSACEIEISHGDNLCEFASIQNDLARDFKYACLKCSTNMPEFIFGREDLGYNFIKTQISLKLDTKNRAISPLTQDLFDIYKDRLSIRVMNDSDFSHLINRLNDSEMFRTDRIYLDPSFPLSAAGKRYAGWCQDLKKRGSFFLELLFDSDAVGFYEFNENNGKSFKTALGGIYLDKTEYSFLFPAFCMKVIEYLITRGMKTITGAVSSNNGPVLKMHLSTGYQISDMTYVYIRHF